MTSLRGRRAELLFDELAEAERRAEAERWGKAALRSCFELAAARREKAEKKVERLRAMLEEAEDELAVLAEAERRAAEKLRAVLADKR